MGYDGGALVDLELMAHTSPNKKRQPSEDDCRL